MYTYICIQAAGSRLGASFPASVATTNDRPLNDKRHPRKKSKKQRRSAHTEHSNSSVLPHLPFSPFLAMYNMQSRTLGGPCTDRCPSRHRVSPQDVCRDHCCSRRGASCTKFTSAGASVPGEATGSVNNICV